MLFEICLRGRLELDSCYKGYRERETVIRQFLKKGSMSKDALFKLAGPELGQSMLDTKGLVHHIDSDQVTIQSTLVTRWCEKRVEENEKTRSDRGL
jgi:hypothetical protein